MADIDQAVAQLEGVTRSGREALVRMLTRASRCHSLWITTTNEHRRWDRLAVAETPDPDLPGARGSNWEFEW
jgi:hypothetical protein